MISSTNLNIVLTNVLCCIPDKALKIYNKLKVSDKCAIK